MEPIKEGEEQRNDTPLTLVLEPDPESQERKASLAALGADFMQPRYCYRLRRSRDERSHR